jgi:uncharacterized protein YegL
MNNLQIDVNDLVNNPTPRVPVCLCLDSSYSMVGEPMNELNEGIQLFFEAIRADIVAKWSAEIAVVTFGHEVKLLLEYQMIDRQIVPVIEATGESTRMGEGVEIALNLLEKRKQTYSSLGIDYYQPWLVLMTDGRPTDDINVAARRTSELILQKRLSMFPVGVGPQADLEYLKPFSPLRSPLRLKGLNFPAFFEWLSKSVGCIPRSTLGQSIPLDSEGLGWAEL